MRSTLSAVSAVLAAQRQERVERRLNRIADRERLDRGFGDEEARAEVGDHLLGLRLRATCASSTLCSPSSTSATPVKPSLHHQSRR